MIWYIRPLNQMALPDSRGGSEFLLMPIQEIMTKEDKIVRALIIDDDIDTCILLSRILVENKIKSLSVNTLRDAENVFEKVNPALIFLDNNLPDGYGLNFLSYIKEKFPDAQIVMITAHSSDFSRKAALLKGAEYFLEKPFSLNDINNVIHSLSLDDIDDMHDK
jgi:two-component system, OmpR family, response regulator